MLIDTHTHLYLPEFEDGGKEAVTRAMEAGVEHLVFPNVNEETVEPMRRLAAQFPENVSMAMGLHPTELGDDWQASLARIMKEAKKEEYVAIGEVGMDLYWDKSREQEQMQVFDAQLSLAEELSLPVIIHCREAQPQTLEVLQGHPGVRAVFHSFGGTIEDVSEIRKVGDFYFGINGIVTFKNCNVRDSLPEITLSRVVLETDSPYLAPVPKRGKRNESAYLPHVAAHIATHLSLPVEEVAAATTANAFALFTKLRK